MAKNKFNQHWLQRHLNDPYVAMAQKEGYRARSVYKLQEIDLTEKIIHPNQTVVDLGSAPGSWSQYVRNKMGRTIGASGAARIFALDKLMMDPIPDVTFIQGDFTEESVILRLETHLVARKVDVVLSDMAPNISGIALRDAACIEDMIDQVVHFSQTYLKPEGILLVKCFHGLSYNTVWEQCRAAFKKVAVKKPKASRGESAEVFILGRGLT